LDLTRLKRQSESTPSGSDRFLAAIFREWLDESDPDTMVVIRERVRQIKAGEATLIDGNQVQQEMRQLARQIANQ
jgi:3-methyladenine DNA glycosylase AlkC